MLELLHMLGKQVFVGVAEDDIDTFYFTDFLRIDLRKAAHHCHYGIGVSIYGMVYGGAAFLFGNGGNCACVDDINICNTFKINHLIATLDKLAHHVRTFGEIQLTA